MNPKPIGRPRTLPAPDGMYGCPACLEVKPVSAFHRTWRGPDGHSYICIECKRVERRKMRERKRAALLAQRTEETK